MLMERYLGEGREAIRVGEALTKSIKSRASFGGAILKVVVDKGRWIDLIAVVVAFFAILGRRRMRGVSRRADSIEWEGKMEEESQVM